MLEEFWFYRKKWHLTCNCLNFFFIKENLVYFNESICQFFMLELDPQPYLFGDVNQSMRQGSFQFPIYSEGDKDTDFINQLPLETIINSSLRTTIQTQYVFKYT